MKSKETMDEHLAPASNAVTVTRMDDEDSESITEIERPPTLPRFSLSSDTDSDEVLEFGGASSTSSSRTFHNIISLLVGSGAAVSSVSSHLRASPGRGIRDEIHATDSDSDSSGGDFWRYRPAPATPRPTLPDTSVIVDSEITALTNAACGLEDKSSDLSLPAALSKRSLGMPFNSMAKRRMGGRFLPYVSQIVAQYKNKVFCGTYARDGDLFMTACQDRFVRLYNTEKGNFKLLQSIQANDVGWSILDTALSPEGTHLVYSSWSDCLHQVSILNEEERHIALPLSPDNRRFCIFSVTFSSDSQEVLGGANDGFLYLYDRNANVQSLRIDAHEDDVNAVCFVDETTHIVASGGDDGICKVWDRRALREDNPIPVGVLAGHIDGITYVDPRGDGRHLITNSKDQSIKLWDIRKFSDMDTVEGGKKAVANQKWDYRWQKVPKIMTSSKAPRVDGDSSVMTYTGHTVLQTLIRCHFSPQFSTGQKYIYTGCAAGRVVIYDLLTGKIVSALSDHTSCVRDVSWHPYMQELVSSSWDSKVRRWRVGGGEDDGEEGGPNKKMKNGCKRTSRKRTISPVDMMIND